jgi:hypothetical protein
MSSGDPTLQMNSKHGNMTQHYRSEESIYHVRGWKRTNIAVVDNSFYTKPIGREADFGQTDRYRFRRRGGRVGKTWLKVTISPSVLAVVAGPVGPVRAAYADDLGALILANARAEYASKEIQAYPGELVKAYKRLLEHDITKEHYNATNFAHIPPGVDANVEQIREANLRDGCVILPELEWFYWTRFEDYAMTPEALTSELEIAIDWSPLERIIYARNADGSIPVGDIFAPGGRPRITEALLYTQLIHVPGPEQDRHLRRFESEQGILFKLLDLELQLRQSFSNNAGTYAFKLDNLRLESQFLLFYIRKGAIDQPWALDRHQTSTADTILTAAGATSTAALEPIISFRLIANGKVLIDPCTDTENRAVWRKIYFPGSQVSEPIYFVPFGEMLRDARNTVNFQNMANLGTVELEITVAQSVVHLGAPQNRLFDLYNVCHNVVQQKKGDIIRVLR